MKRHQNSINAFLNAKNLRSLAVFVCLRLTRVTRAGEPLVSPSKI